MKASCRTFFLCLAFLFGLTGASAQSPVRLRTVVIDPGHGGHDPGCVSRDSIRTTEKFLTLDIARRLKDRIIGQHPDVKVILTRGDDTYVTLSGRANMANNAEADLFISIHINAAASGTRASGYSVHCLGQSTREGNDLFSKNLELCKRENSVIKLEDDYETTYQGFDPSDPQSYIFFSLMQNANLGLSLTFAEDVATAMKEGPVRVNRGVSQDPFWVLWRTTMPAVLIECAFITNPGDLAVLRRENDREAIAGCIARAVTTYKQRLEGSAGESVTAPAAETPAPSDTAARTVPSEPQILYGTQVLASRKPIRADDPFFRGYAPTEIAGETWIRYVVGTSADPEEAKKKNTEIRKIFPDSFLVKIEGNSLRRIY